MTIPDGYRFDPSAQPCDLLIRNAYLITADARRTKFSNGAVAVTGRDIVAVGDDKDLAARYRPARIIDARGGMVTPGAIDLHYHATVHLPAKMLSVGAAPSGDVGAWITAGYTPLIDSMEEDDDYASSLLAGLDMLLSGVTMFVDPGTATEPDATAAACTALGMRASLADPYLMDTPGPETMDLRRAPYSATRNMRILGTQVRRNRDPQALVRGHVSVYGVGSNSREMSIAAHACAVENDVTFNTHQSQSIDDTQYDRNRFGCAPMLWWKDIAVLDSHCSFVHMNVLDESEVPLIHDSGATVVWSPQNSWFYGTRQHARLRHPSLFHLGTNVAIGVDTEKAVTFGNQAYTAYLLARDQEEDLSPEDILQIQTLNGARALKIDRWLGSIEVGKRADLVLRTADLPEARPRVQYERQQLLLAGSRSVDTVIVDGRVVVKGGRHTMLDHEAIYEAAERSVARMAQRVQSR